MQNKYIELVNFIDLCASAFLNIIDDAYNKAYYTPNGDIVIDFDARTMKLFHCCIEETLKTSKSYGKIQVFYGTCRPWNNWRKEARGRAVRSMKYSVADDSILVDITRLERAIDFEWQKYSENAARFTIENAEIDSYDLELIITDIIGRDFTSNYYCAFQIITDLNYLYDHTVPKVIPNYLYQEVERYLTNLKLV
jgi:hypothetical protein